MRCCRIQTIRSRIEPSIRASPPARRSRSSLHWRQMANMMAMVANEGVSYKPHVVRGFRRPGHDDVQTVVPEVLHRVDVPQEFWSTLKDALVGVVEEGTAANSRIDGLTWAGKTGSA